MEVILGRDIDDALSKEYRNYLTGHLTRPQLHLNHLEDDIEIGISEYTEFTADTPHLHPIATEHCYVLKGSIKIRYYTDYMEEVELHQGDFFMFRPGEWHATKNKKGTRILFIKSPGTNDKTLMDVDDDTQEWLKHWD